ncbi:MAG: site-2 protease family protein [Patescibacteria group bacterium]|nr:site-2 protease family protein [Patescibacteria group bacterium]MDE2590714.1 site-2 protease family protein [Patescibacteria group bacterium]
MELILGIVVLVFSAILHEIAHGYVADRLGDPTARIMGRLTLDPRKHIDPFFSIILPLLLIVSGSPVIFGGAKPVPVDPFNLREGRKDLALVSLAGPLTNVVLAIIAALFLKFLPLLVGTNQALIFSGGFVFARLLFNTIVNYNLLLAIFNLLPIPPLDGSKVFSLLLPQRESAVYLSLGQFGIFILLFLLAFPIAGFSLEAFMYNLFILARSFLGM